MFGKQSDSVCDTIYAYVQIYFSHFGIFHQIKCLVIDPRIASSESL